MYLKQLNILMSKTLNNNQMNLDTQQVLDMRLGNWKKELSQTKGSIDDYKRHIKRLIRNFDRIRIEKKMSLNEAVDVIKK